MASFSHENEKVPFPVEDLRESILTIAIGEDNKVESPASGDSDEELECEKTLRQFMDKSSSTNRIRTMTEGNVCETNVQVQKPVRGRYYTEDIGRMSAVARCESWKYEACGKFPPRCKTPSPGRHHSVPKMLSQSDINECFISSSEKYVPPHIRNKNSLQNDNRTAKSENESSKGLAISLHHAALTPGSEATKNEIVIETSGVGGNLEGMWWSVGVSCHQGTRSKNEDDFIIIPDLESPKETEGQKYEGYFAVFDGHCGVLAANYAKEKLHVYATQDVRYYSDLEAAFTDACKRVDTEFLELSTEEGYYDGTTAIFAVIRNSQLVVGNIGDCAAVLCRDKKAFILSNAHKPAREDEKQRILDANGWVTADEDGISRVCGELSVSRAIGDIDYKGMCNKDVSQCFFAFPDGHNMQFKADLITAEPQFMSTNITPQDDFLLIACDGLWDVMDEATAVEVTRELLEEDDNVESVAKKMCHLAEKMGSPDNITVMVIKLHHEVT